MTLEELAKLAAQTRLAQEEYDLTRTPTAKQVRNDFQRRLDREVKAILHPPQKGLFDDDGGE